MGDVQTRRGAGPSNQPPEKHKASAAARAFLLLVLLAFLPAAQAGAEDAVRRPPAVEDFVQANVCCQPLVQAIYNEAYEEASEQQKLFSASTGRTFATACAEVLQSNDCYSPVCRALILVPSNPPTDADGGLDEYRLHLMVKFGYDQTYFRTDVVLSVGAECHY